MHYRQAIECKAAILYLQPTHSSIPHKEKFWVLILFMKTPKIFFKVMEKSACALWSGRISAYGPVLFLFFFSFRYNLSSNQILCGVFNKGRIESSLPATRSHLHRGDKGRGVGGRGAQKILLVWMEITCQEDWSCHLLECAKNDNWHAKSCKH